MKRYIIVSFLLLAGLCAPLFANGTGKMFVAGDFIRLYFGSDDPFKDGTANAGLINEQSSFDDNSIEGTLLDMAPTETGHVILIIKDRGGSDWRVRINNNSPYYYFWADEQHGSSSNWTYLWVKGTLTCDTSESEFDDYVLYATNDGYYESYKYNPYEG